jgi:hypothetical protein
MTIEHASEQSRLGSPLSKALEVEAQRVSGKPQVVSCAQ